MLDWVKAGRVVLRALAQPWSCYCCARSARSELGGGVAVGARGGELKSSYFVNWRRYIYFLYGFLYGEFA